MIVKASLVSRTSSPSVNKGVRNLRLARSTSLWHIRHPPTTALQLELHGMLATQFRRCKISWLQPTAMHIQMTALPQSWRGKLGASGSAHPAAGPSRECVAVINLEVKKVNMRAFSSARQGLSGQWIRVVLF